MKTKEILIWVGIIVVLIAGLWGLVAAVNNSPSPSNGKPIKGIPPISNQDYVRGDQTAKVTLVEYGDFQCPSCGSYYPLVKKLESDFPKDLKVVYRFFPLINIHQNAMVAAQAAYAAGKQNKFWEMHDMLYENQNSWSAQSSPKDIFTDYAKKLGLDLNKFKADIDADSTRQFISNSEDKAASVGVNSTPTFFVNGASIQNPTSYEDFKKLIQDALTK